MPKKQANGNARKIGLNLEEIEESFGPWKKIKDDPSIHDIFLSYIEYAKESVPEQADIIEQMLEDHSIHALGIIAHEKFEVVKYLKAGYTKEDIGNGKAHEEYYDEAHDKATVMQFRLYEHASKCVGGIPSLALILCSPTIEIIYGTHEKGGDIDQSTCFSKLIKDQKITSDDIEKAISFFEKGGYTYKNRGSVKRSSIAYAKELGFYKKA